ncbi:MAG: photosynthetic reaction center subunit H [Sphingomonadaceae bacterium]
MHSPIFFGRMDGAELMFYIFCFFFLGLVIWLQRESHREGFPLEDDVTGRKLAHGGITQVPPTKIFHMPFGEDDVVTPTRETQPLEIATARRTAPWGGSPIEPIGGGVGAGIGPGAYADRRDVPDRTHEGHLRIVPISDTEITVETRDADPRGMTAIGADGEAAGTITNLWVDRSEMMLRYLEVTVGGKAVLMPMTMCVVDRKRHQVECSAINAAQFAGAPTIATPGTITRLEEDKIVAYFGGGYLYANASRSEPLL